MDDDDSIPDAALEFNPTADVSQFFVEPPPSPEWTAATGTFKAIVLKSEEAAAAPVAPKPSPQAPDLAASHTSSSPKAAHGGGDEIELDADFLSATSQMRKLQLGLGEPDPTGSSRPTKAEENNIAASPVSAAVEPVRPRIAPQGRPPAAPAPSSPPTAPPSSAPSPAAQAPVAPSPAAHAPTTHAQFVAASKPAPRSTPAETQSHLSPMPPVSAQSSVNLQPPVSSLAAPPRAALPADAAPIEPKVVSRPPPRKTIQAFGVDAEPPPEQVAALARARVAPPPIAPVELERAASQSFLDSPTLWSAGAGALAILLAVQILNHYRDDLAATAQFNKPITALYAAFGVHLTPRWDLHVYDVRQLGASVDAETAGQIMVRASVKNGGHQAQPMPLLRVTLQDRFGNRIAARDVAPGNYLPRAIPAESFLSAGQRIDAEMAFVDPGSNAVGFEIDACLPAPAGGIACANDPVSR